MKVWSCIFIFGKFSKDSKGLEFSWEGGFPSQIWSWMMTRESILEQALELSKEHKYLILNWATGVGKSRGAIEIAALDKPARILLIVAEIPHKENWKKEFERWNPELWSKVTVECYASLKNYKDTEWHQKVHDQAQHDDGQAGVADHAVGVDIDDLKQKLQRLQQQGIQYLKKCHSSFSSCVAVSSFIFRSR